MGETRRARKKPIGEQAIVVVGASSGVGRAARSSAWTALRLHRAKIALAGAVAATLPVVLAAGRRRCERRPGP